jgi:hypothetical protein
LSEVDIVVGSALAAGKSNFVKISELSERFSTLLVRF